MIDVTPIIKKEIDKIGAIEGVCNLFAKGSTSALTTIEFEDGLIEDFFDSMEILAPSSKPYKHHLKWNDDNGRSHIRASTIGNSLSIPILDGKLCLGTWQQIVLINFDTRDRRRELVGVVLYK